jgi:hypothetical protein
VLEKVTDAAMNGVEARGEGAEQIAHAVREVGQRRLEDQMKMIRHEDPGVEDPLVLEDDLREESDEREAVAVAADDLAAFIFARGDCTDRPGRCSEGDGSLMAEASAGRRGVWAIRGYLGSGKVAFPDPNFWT